MANKTTTHQPSTFDEAWSNPAGWDNGIPIDGDSVILSDIGGNTNGSTDDFAALSLSALTEQGTSLLSVQGSQLTIGTLVGAANLTGVVADAEDAGAPVSVTIDEVATPDLYLKAVGTGALIADQSATDAGEDYIVDDGGKIILSAAPASTSTFDYEQDGGTFAFETLGSTTASTFDTVGVGDVLEVPGSSVSSVTIGPTSLRVTTDKGAYAFTNVNFESGIKGYTASFDQTTGLVAVGFDKIDRFQQAVATAGRYLWSNAANWSAGVPTNGATISVGATGYDDLAALTLASLTLNATGDAVIHVTGASLTVDSLTVSGSGGSAVLDADAADAGASVTVTVQQVATPGATLSATGAGADLLDNSAEASAQTTDYAVAQGGLVELSNAPLTTDIFTYTSNGAFAFENPGAADLALFEGVGAGSTIEVPGGAVLGVTVGTNSVAIGTDLGNYAFDRVIFATPVTNHTASVDFSTVLQAVTFRGTDTFTPNAGLTGLAKFLWSSAANWTEGVPVKGDSVLTTYYGIDDIQNLTLAGLTLSSVNNVVAEHSLTVAMLTEGTNTLVSAESDSPAAPAVLTIGTIVGAPYDNVIEAQGAGATVIDRSATDLAGQGVAGIPGMQYEVNAGGTLEFLSAAPAAISQFVFYDSTGKGAGGEGTIAFGAPGATVAATLGNIAPNDILELPGTSVSNVVFGANSLTVTTDAGTVAFTNVTYGKPVTGYTTARDAATGLVAISFTGSDTFEPNVMATSGIFAGSYLWSNAANWSDGVPISGDTVQISTSGGSIDDVPNLSLPVLQLGFSVPAGLSETIDSVDVLGNNLTVGTLEATPGQNHPGGVLVAGGDQGLPGGGPSTVTVNAGAGGDMILEAEGIGAHLIDKTTPEAGVDNVRAYEISDANETETYEPLLANDTVDLTGPSYGTSKPAETIAFHDPGASNPGSLLNVAAGDIVEVPGTVALSVTIGTTSLTLTTDAGSYNFSNVTYSSLYPVGNYTTFDDATTGLVAIAFSGVDTFSDNVKVTSGRLVGQSLWSNPANWSNGLPINGGVVQYTPLARGVDDIAALNLSCLKIAGGTVYVTGGSLNVGTIVTGGTASQSGDYQSQISADEEDAGIPVTVTVGTIIGTAGEFDADGFGASFVGPTTADPGDTFYFSANGGVVRLPVTPADTSELRYDGLPSTFELDNPAATINAELSDVEPGDVLELPGTSVSNFILRTTSLSVTTDAGSYQFTHFADGDFPVAGYTATSVASTGLVAITFTDVDTFLANAKAASGPLSGDYLWSNAANWSDGALPTSALAATLPAGVYTTAIATGESESANAVTVGAGATLAVDGALRVTAGLTVSGALLAYGAITVGGDFTVAGGGNVVLRGNIVVTGKYIEGDDTTLGPGGSLTADAIDVTAGGRFTLDGGTAAGQSFDLSGGVLELASGSFDLRLTSGEYGTIQIDAGTALELSGAASSGITADFAGPAATLTLADPAGFDGVIGGAGSGDTIMFGTGGVSVVGYAVGGGGIGTLTLDIGGTDTAIRFADGNAYDVGNFVPGPDDGGGTTLSVNCFAAGTRIMTAAGLVAVEVLREGDIVRTHFAGAAPICWIGHRRVDCRRHPDPTLVWPVRVAAGAFGPGMPDRDLRLSPDHAVYVEDVLIPIRQLLNGTTIAQTECDKITYYHVELGHHDVLFAEGLPAESYLDTGNRAVFENAAMPIMLHPGFSRSLKPDSTVKSCAKLMVEAERVEPIWRRLAARSATLGRPVSLPAAATDPLLRLVVADCDVAPVEVIDDRYMFVLPPRTCWATIRSRAAAPSDLRPWLDDRRRLGVSVSRIVLRSGTSRTDIPVDHPALADGWHDVELAGTRLWRWTDGGALLPVSAGTNMIEIHLSGSVEYPARPEIVGRSFAGGLPPHWEPAQAR